MAKDPLYDAVVAQGSFLEKHSGHIQKIPNVVRAVDTQAQGLVQLFQRVAMLEKALNMASRALPQGRPARQAPHQAMRQLPRVVQAPAAVQEQAELAAADFDFDNEEDAETDDEG